MEGSAALQPLTHARSASLFRHRACHLAARPVRYAAVHPRGRAPHTSRRHHVQPPVGAGVRRRHPVQQPLAREAPRPTRGARVRVFAPRRNGAMTPHDARDTTRPPSPRSVDHKAGPNSRLSGAAGAAARAGMPCRAPFWTSGASRSCTSRGWCDDRPNSVKQHAGSGWESIMRQSIERRPKGGNTPETLLPSRTISARVAAISR